MAQRAGSVPAAGLTRVVRDVVASMAEWLPAYALLRSVSGVWSVVGVIFLAEIRGIGWHTTFSQL
jgi:hypothetical protein